MTPILRYPLPPPPDAELATFPYYKKREEFLSSVIDGGFPSFVIAVQFEGKESATRIERMISRTGMYPGASVRYRQAPETSFIAWDIHDSRTYQNLPVGSYVVTRFVDFEIVSESWFNAHFEPLFALAKSHELPPSVTEHPGLPFATVQLAATDNTPETKKALTKKATNALAQWFLIRYRDQRRTTQHWGMCPWSEDFVPEVSGNRYVFEMGIVVGLSNLYEAEVGQFILESPGPGTVVQVPKIHLPHLLSEGEYPNPVPRNIPLKGNPHVSRLTFQPRTLFYESVATGTTHTFNIWERTG